MGFCPKCGKNIRSATKLCGACDRGQEGKEAKVSKPEGKNKKTKKKRLKFRAKKLDPVLVAIVSLLGILVIGGGAAIVLKTRENSEPIKVVVNEIKENTKSTPSLKEIPPNSNQTPVPPAKPSVKNPKPPVNNDETEKKKQALINALESAVEQLDKKGPEYNILTGEVASHIFEQMIALEKGDSSAVSEKNRIYVLAETKGEAAIPELAIAIRHKSKLVRAYAAMELGEVGIKGIPLLIEMLERDEPEIQFFATVSLGALGAKAKSALPAMQRAQKENKDEMLGKALKISILDISSN